MRWPTPSCPRARRSDLHRRAARLLSASGYRPALVADHLLRQAGQLPTRAWGPRWFEAVAATRSYAPEVTADLLDDVAAMSGPEVPEPMLVDYGHGPVPARPRAERRNGDPGARIGRRHRCRPWPPSCRPP